MQVYLPNVSRVHLVRLNSFKQMKKLIMVKDYFTAKALLLLQLIKFDTD